MITTPEGRLSWERVLSLLTVALGVVGFLGVTLFGDRFIAADSTLIHGACVLVITEGLRQYRARRRADEVTP